MKYERPNEKLLQELLRLNVRVVEVASLYGIEAALDWAAEKRKAIMEKYK